MSVCLLCVRHGDTEFVRFQAGGNIRMGFGVHIRIDAQRNRRGFAQPLRHGVDSVQLGQAFHIEALNAGIQREFDFDLAFANARKNDFVRAAARRQHPCDFAARHGIETAAQPCEMLDDAQIAVGFDGIANQRVERGKGGLVTRIGLGQLVFAIHIQRRAELCRQLSEFNIFNGFHAYFPWVSLRPAAACV